MYAFNKRFRPTLIMGAVTAGTAAFGCLAIMLFLFSLVVVFNVKSIAFGLVLIFSSFVALIAAYKSHKNKNRIRYASALFVGAMDKKAKPLELG